VRSYANIHPLSASPEAARRSPDPFDTSHVQATRYYSSVTFEASASAGSYSNDWQHFSSPSSPDNDLAADFQNLAFPPTPQLLANLQKDLGKDELLANLDLAAGAACVEIPKLRPPQAPKSIAGANTMNSWDKVVNKTGVEGCTSQASGFGDDADWTNMAAMRPLTNSFSSEFNACSKTAAPVPKVIIGLPGLPNLHAVLAAIVFYLLVLPYNFGLAEKCD
jgi:hypothetical protein